MTAAHQPETAAMVRLAHEGVPVAAIARGLGQPAEEVWPVLREARERGELIELPPADWRPGSSRGDRAPASSPALPRPDEERLALALADAFDLAGQESRFLAALATRRQATSDALLSAMRSRGEADVLKAVVCRLRVKLRPHGIDFRTVVGLGYAMDGDTARRLIEAARASAEDRL